MMDRLRQVSLLSLMISVFTVSGKSECLRLPGAFVHICNVVGTKKLLGNAELADKNLAHGEDAVCLLTENCLESF
jgi:hypothetical protein